MPNRMEGGNGRNHPKVNDYGMKMNNNFAYTYLHNNRNFHQILPSNSPNLPSESGQYYPSGVGGRGGRIAIGAASATMPSYAAATNNAFMGEMMMRQGMMVGGSDGFRGGQSLGSLSAGLNSMHSNFNGNTRRQPAIRYNNHEESTNISARPTQQQLFLPQNPNGDLPPVHVYASLSLKDVHSQSISNKGRASSASNLRRDTVMFSALAQPSMTWAQLTRHMIEADLDNDSSKWLLPLSVRDEFNSKSHDSDGNNNIYGRFLRYGDGYATYLCPMENERYIHPRPSNYLPLLPLPSVNFEASIFAHLCAPSGPLFHHPPHPEDLVLETLNCYPEYKDMPIVEWRLRLMPLKDAVELAPVLFVNLSIEGDENDGKVGDDKSGKRGASTEAHVKGATNTDNSQKDTMHGNTDKVNALIYTLDERRPGCIGNYSTIPWKTFFSTFAPFAPRRGMDVVDVRAMMSQRSGKEAEIHMAAIRASPASTMQSANTNASTEDLNSKITYNHTIGKKRKMVLPIKKNKHDGGDDDLVMDNGVSGSGADITDNPGTPIKTTKSKQSISHQLLQSSGKDDENSSPRPQKQHDDEDVVEDNIRNKSSIDEHDTEKKSGTGKKFHKKMKKDPNASKRKIGAYSWFMKVNRALIQEENPENSQQFTRLVARHFNDVEQDEQDFSSPITEGDEQRYENEKERCSGTPSERNAEEARTDANSDKLAVVWEVGTGKHPKERGDENIMGPTEIIPGKEAKGNSNELNEESYSTAADIDDAIEKDDVKTGVEGNGEDCKFEDATE